LLAIAADTLALLLRDSPVRILILNGKSVVDQFQEMTGVRLERQEMQGWALPRQKTPDVPGFAYKGVVNTLSGVELRNQILVLGYNHNIQSSFGVTSVVIHAIHNWVAEITREEVR
jgi:hypothetical protein